MTRRYDARKAKPHLCYTALELAAVFEVTVTTVRHWKKGGLEPIDNHRPHLFAGRDVAPFLETHNKPRQPSGRGEMYCVACKRTVVPMGDTVDLVVLSERIGELIGICPHCGRRPHRRVRLAEVTDKAGHLTVRYEDDAATLSTLGQPPHTACSEGDAK